MSNQEAETVERQYWIDMSNALKRLEKNEDFKLVIKEGYFKDKAVNGVSLLATDYVIENNLRTKVMEGLIAVSHLEDHLATIHNMAASAEADNEEVGE